MPYKNIFLKKANTAFKDARRRCKKNPHYIKRGTEFRFTCFRDFLKEVGLPPKLGMDCVIDRINNNGHYEPGNLRWANKYLSIINRRLIRGKIGFIGVERYIRRYKARIRNHGIQEYLGYFNTPEEAALAYDKRAFEIWGSDAKLNFPQMNLFQWQMKSKSFL